MKVAVIIATVGRPEEAARWLEHCCRQTLPPSELIYSIARPSDLPEDFASLTARVVTGPGGLTIQRNAGMAALTSAPDIIAFFDDDYVPSRYCFEGIAKAFAEQPDLVVVTGSLLADGINSSGLPYLEARRTIDDFDASHRWPETMLADVAGAYGCNMAYRASAIVGEVFDERLPLYGWQEDIDFSRRIARRGRMGKSNLFAGVHQGAKGGRTSGRRLGYSQVINIVYLMHKGTMPAGKGFTLMGRNLLANHIRALRPEPWVDRKGRIAGNWKGLADVVRGRIKPERALDL